MLTVIANEAKSEPQLVDAWDAFWMLYPRREAKKDAMKAWSQINARAHVPILTAVTEWRRIWHAQGRDSRTIPYPATWLRGERWEDEIPPEFTQVAARAATTLPELPPKSGDIPAHVLAQIAKLKRA